MSRGRAHLRRSELAAEQAHLLANAILQNPGARLERGRSSEDDAARARAIPIIGPISGGGAIPGTRPDTSTRRLIMPPRRLTVDDLNPDDPPFFRKILERPEPLTPEQERREKTYRNWSARQAYRQAKSRGATHADRISREEIIERDQRICYLCDKTCELNDIHIDHIHPISKGGSHTYDNLGVTCADCNLRKGDMPTSRRPAALRASVVPPAGDT